MADMNRRLNAIEKRLRVGRESEPVVVIIRDFHVQDHGQFDLSKPVEEWLTYPEAMQKAPL